MSNNDMKEVGSALAKAINEDKATISVGEKVVTAVKKAHKRKDVMKGGKQEKSFVESLFSRLQQCSEDMQILVDRLDEIDGVSDLQHLKAIKRAF